MPARIPTIDDNISIIETTTTDDVINNKSSSLRQSYKDDVRVIKSNQNNYDVVESSSSAVLTTHRENENENKNNHRNVAANNRNNHDKNNKKKKKMVTFGHHTTTIIIQDRVELTLEEKLKSFYSSDEMSRIINDVRMTIQLLLSKENNKTIFIPTNPNTTNICGRGLEKALRKNLKSGKDYEFKKQKHHRVILSIQRLHRLLHGKVDPEELRTLSEKNSQFSVNKAIHYAKLDAMNVIKQS